MAAWDLISLLVAAAGWLAGVGVFSRTRSHRVAALDAANVQDPRTVSIIIPARDEAQRLPTLLASVQTQTAKPFEVIVVDDNSTDATADVARRYGARVVPAGELPDGWRGKAHACQVGAEASTGERLLFLDADTWFDAPHGLQHLLSHFTAGAVSVAPFHSVSTLGEQGSAFFNLAMTAGAGAFTLIPRAATGMFGQTLLIDRALYERVGGHAAVRGEILENLHLAPRIIAAGGRIECGLGKGIAAMRMYPDGVRAAARGWAKAFADGAASIRLTTLLAVVLWYAGAVSATALLVSARTSLGAAAYLAFVAQFYYAFRKLGTFRWYLSAMFPAPLTFFFVVFFVSSVLRSRGHDVEWKGRVLRAG